MITKQTRNDKGFTLIEVLATLSILSLIILAGLKIYDASSTNNGKVHDVVNLQQESNLLIAEIESSFKNSSGIGDLAFDSGDDITITDIKANDVTQPIESPLTDINFDLPLRFDITTESKDGKTITIQTSWKPTKPTDIIIR